MIKKSDILPYKLMKERRQKQFFQIIKTQEEPEVYGREGNRKRVFYIEDTVSQTNPDRLMVGHTPQNIYWDRFNVGLPIQFFGHELIFDKASQYCIRKYGLLVESEEIRGNDFERVLRDKSALSEYSKIFTHSERVLDALPNAAFIPACGMWYGTSRFGGVLTDSQYEKKTKNISMFSSQKSGLKYYNIRLAVADRVKRTGIVDGFGPYFGKWIEKKADGLTDYRYSIVIENDKKPLYFTEKILDCFASMTVPIYVGADKIGEFFNLDGIILLDERNIDNITDIIRGCDEKDYRNRLKAILDNYRRVQRYRCIEDYIMREYGQDFILS